MIKKLFFIIIASISISAFSEMIHYEGYDLNQKKCKLSIDIKSHRAIVEFESYSYLPFYVSDKQYSKYSINSVLVGKIKNCELVLVIEGKDTENPVEPDQGKIIKSATIFASKDDTNTIAFCTGLNLIN